MSILLKLRVILGTAYSFNRRYFNSGHIRSRNVYIFRLYSRHFYCPVPHGGPYPRFLIPRSILCLLGTLCISFFFVLYV